MMIDLAFSSGPKRDRVIVKRDSTLHSKAEVSYKTKIFNIELCSILADHKKSKGRNAIVRQFVSPRSMFEPVFSMSPLFFLIVIQWLACDIRERK